ncbi:hypothetical protein H6F94_18585 [Leptolyngbya sp. FACHB-261]|nr:hypothetical protein [Leptolyngbya sp. FACHB-261]
MQRSGAFYNPNLSDADAVQSLLRTEFQQQTRAAAGDVEAIVGRLTVEVLRVCERSERIQNSGEVRVWSLDLARQRLHRILNYYRSGATRGRVDLHSTLSAMVYRYVALSRKHVGFQARRTLIEDFLQSFYVEALNVFRRENHLEASYCPRSLLELSEFLAFVEQYAKRRIGLRGGRSQQLIVLRAQSFAKRQPPELTLDIEQAAGASRYDEDDRYNTGSQIQQVREQMVAEADDPAEAVLRERVIAELISYLSERGQEQCVNYLTLRLQDLSVPEIDGMLGLTPRERDYLQQRFRYHITRFALVHHWQLVHQWLEADLDQRLGMPTPVWEEFLKQLSEGERELLVFKQARLDDKAIARKLRWTAKQLQMRWFGLLARAWEVRNDGHGIA